MKQKSEAKGRLGVATQGQHHVSSDTDQGHCKDPLDFLSERAAHELSNVRGRLPETVRGRIRGKSQHVAGDRRKTFRFVPYVAEALLALAYV